MTYAQELNRDLVLNFYRDYDKTREAYNKVNEYEKNLKDCKVSIISPEFRNSIEYYLNTHNKETESGYIYKNRKWV